MKQDENITSQAAERSKVYSAPRRFDLATLFVIMVVYACLLGLFEALGMPEEPMYFILGFLTLVAISQPLLFGGNKPRLASVIVGCVSMPIIVFLIPAFRGRSMSVGEAVFSFVSSIPLGIFLGYVVGALIGGVFLVADVLRQGRGVVE